MVVELLGTGVAVPDVDADDVAVDEDELELVVIVEEVEEEVAVVKGIDDVLEDVTTAHWLFLHS